MKPISIAHEEFKQSLANLINRSELPTILVEYALADILREVRYVNQEQLKQDLAQSESPEQECEAEC